MTGRRVAELRGRKALGLVTTLVWALLDETQWIPGTKVTNLRNFFKLFFFSMGKQKRLQLEIMKLQINNRHAVVFTRSNL